MRKLAAVEDARAVMTEGMDWSAWRWLLERSRVRQIADRATAALDSAATRVKSAWPADLKVAYSELVIANKNHNKNHTGESATSIPELRSLAKRIKDAEDKAERCRLAAEATFDEAEQRFSADLARQGARKALETYDLREAAIGKAEAAAKQLQAPAGREPANSNERSH